MVVATPAQTRVSESVRNEGSLAHMEGPARDLLRESVCKGVVHFTDWWGSLLPMADVYISPTTHPLVLKRKRKRRAKEKKKKRV